MFLKQVEKTVTQGFQNLAKLQKKDGHWVFPLEADTTISSEYIILNHYLGKPEITIEKKLANFIKKKQKRVQMRQTTISLMARKTSKRLSSRFCLR